MNENLRAENRMLKEQLELLVKDDERNQEVIIELKGRINKTIEYIKEHTLIDYYGMPRFNNQKNVEELLEILGDKENE